MIQCWESEAAQQAGDLGKEGQVVCGSGGDGLGFTKATGSHPLF